MNLTNNRKLLLFIVLFLTASFFTAVYIMLVHSVESRNEQALAYKMKHTSGMFSQWFEGRKELTRLMAGALSSHASDRVAADTFSQMASTTEAGRLMVLYLSSIGCVLPEKSPPPAPGAFKFWQRALSATGETREASLTGPVPSGKDGSGEFLLAVPIHAPGNTNVLRGALALRVPVQALEEEMALILSFYSPNSRFYLLADNKTVVTSSGFSGQAGGAERPPAPLASVPDLVPFKDTFTAYINTSTLVSLPNGEFFAAHQDVQGTPWSLFLLAPADSRMSILGGIRFGLAASWCFFGAFSIYVVRRTKMYEMYKVMSQKDQLTQVGNRMAFEETQKRIRNERRYPVSMVILDVDGLKIINDRLGHAAGDKHLQRIAALLLRCVREEDSVYRIGGDEFAIVAAKTSAQNARGVLTRIEEQINIMRHNIQAPPIHLSFGLADAHDDDSLASLFTRADTAMYRHKESKRQQAVKDLYQWIGDHGGVSHIA